ncbi:unnamed protein product [Camellia sinensis]
MGSTCQANQVLVPHFERIRINILSQRPTERDLDHHISIMSAPLVNPNEDLGLGWDIESLADLNIGEESVSRSAQPNIPLNISLNILFFNTEGVARPNFLQHYMHLHSSRRFHLVIITNTKKEGSEAQFMSQIMGFPNTKTIAPPPSVLRMEQDVEKFIQDPTQQQMEFQQLPTSYLRLAAHRVAQHYSLQSMVLLDNNVPDGSGSRIIVRKNSEYQPPLIRLADIPVNLPMEDSGDIKVAIKQRPQKKSPSVSGANSHSIKSNNSRSVEERKEEYNRARARIFSSSSFSGGAGGRPESEPRRQDNNFHQDSSGISKAEEKSVPGGSDVNVSRGLIDSPTSSSRLARSRTEEPVGRSRTNSRVAIFRDRDGDRKDPDYDRNYDRYMQRFDPGFGFNGGPYTVQPLYSPVLNYNTEFPQLGSAHNPLISTEHQPRSLPQHLPGSWTAAPSTPAGIGYGHPDAMMTLFSQNHVGARSTSALYLHAGQYLCQRPGMPFIHPHEQVHQPFSQPGPGVQAYAAEVGWSEHINLSSSSLRAMLYH